MIIPKPESDDAPLSLNSEPTLTHMQVFMYTYNNECTWKCEINREHWAY